MTRFIGVGIAVVLATGLGGSARAEGGKDPNAVIDKAIKALGGADKIEALHAMSWKANGTITIAGDDNKFSSEAVAEHPGKFRNSFEGEFQGNKISGATILNGDKGWRVFNGETTDLDKDGVDNERRNVYLQLIPTLVAPLKEKAFKVESAGEDKVDGKPATVLKVTGPEGKEFKLYFDNESGLPVKEVANVTGFGGDDAVQEWTFGDYKDFDGFKKATKVAIKRGGEKFMNMEIADFKVLKDVDAKTFDKPK
jgi:hypothetical protein